MSLVALVVWELVHDQPVVNLRLFKIRAFAISNVVMFLFGFIIISTTQLVPQLAQELLRLRRNHGRADAGRRRAWSRCSSCR